MQGRQIMASILGQFFRVVTGIEARERREREEAEARTAAFEREKAEREREALKQYAERQAAAEREAKRREMQLSAGRMMDHFHRNILSRIYLVRYLRLMKEMHDVLTATYESFKLKAISEVGALSNDEYLILFGEAFKHTQLAKDWRMGVLRSLSGDDGRVLGVRVDGLPPDPIWIKDCEDPTGYFRKEVKILDEFEDFIKKHPKWYEEGLIPPGVGGEPSGLQRAYNYFERQLSALTKS